MNYRGMRKSIKAETEERRRYDHILLFRYDELHNPEEHTYLYGQQNWNKEEVLTGMQYNRKERIFVFVTQMYPHNV